MTRPRVLNAFQLEDLLSGSSAGVREILDQESFQRMIAIERKRAERTNEPFLLMLIECINRQKSEKLPYALDDLMTVLLSNSRETDVVGWYRQPQAIGILFTGLASDYKKASLTLLGKVSAALQDKLTFEQFSEIKISLHIFPDEWNQNDSGGPKHLVLYPDVHKAEKHKRVAQGIKRIIDILGSVFLMVLLLPLFVSIAIVVKATSKGPIFFKQQRMGQFGRYFTFYKFRSMRAQNDHSAHREYVTQLISGNAERIAQNGSGEGVFKLVDDPRITRVGRFLRRTSLDELPQFFNVLKGEMSLVGPRPPIPYEVAEYQTWHRRRLLQVKPGITGLWQVMGRSRIPFDEMVRLDLHYATSWTPWLDLKILLLTPAAVIRGSY